MEEIQIKTEPVDFDVDGHMPGSYYTDLPLTEEILPEPVPVTLVASCELNANLELEEAIDLSMHGGQGHLQSLTMVTSHGGTLHDPKTHQHVESTCQNIAIGQRKLKVQTVKIGEAEFDSVTSGISLESSRCQSPTQTSSQNKEKCQGHSEHVTTVTSHQLNLDHIRESSQNATKPSQYLSIQSREGTTDLNEPNCLIKQEPIEDEAAGQSESFPLAVYKVDEPFPLAVYKVDEQSKSLVELPNIVGPSRTTDLDNFSRLIYSSEAQMEIKVYQCPTCYNVVVSKHALQNHLKTHSGVKPYKCSLCDFRCIQRGNFNRHLQIHSIEKPCKCPLCDYSCVNKTRLDKHMLKHSDVKPFKCPLCESRFKRRDQIKVHLKTHYKDDMYRCPLCEYTASYVDAVNVHMVTHSQAAPLISE